MNIKSKFWYFLASRPSVSLRKHPSNKLEEENLATMKFMDRCFFLENGQLEGIFIYQLQLINSYGALLPMAELMTGIVQLILEQHWFELRRPTYMWGFGFFLQWILSVLSICAFHIHGFIQLQFENSNFSSPLHIENTVYKGSLLFISLPALIISSFLY